MDIDAIIQRAKTKEPKALNEIYTMFYPKMVGVCMNIVKEDEDVVCDLVHDAFILAFASLDKLRDNERFGEWLTTIVRNVAIKHIVQKKRLHFVPLSPINPNDGVFLDESSAADSAVNHQDLLNLIARLPEGYSKVFRLSVIEGFSHKEIADMLGIEPHSSSSQLSRAKGMLKRMLGYKMLAIIIVLVVPVALYLIMSRQDEPIVCENKPMKSKMERKDKTVHSEECEDSISPHHQVVEERIDRTDSVLHTLDSVIVPLTHGLQNVMEEERWIADMVENSAVTTPKDSMSISFSDADLYWAVDGTVRKRNWQVLAAGSLGPALAQNIYKIFAADNMGNLDPDVPTPVFPENVRIWEDYSRYLHTTEHEGTPADTIALMEIADHNSGDIVEKEEHDKPIVFGLSFNKALNERWGIETGLQYSLLNSRFVLGDGGYAVVKKQKVHYLGVPLKLSYRMIDHKQLSVYSSAGLTLHIPVYGKVNRNYIVDWRRTYSESRHFIPSLQWQTSLSVGVQYKLKPNMSVFVEPTLNWFVPSGSETHTIWTEHPVMLTSPFGIRFTW